MSCLRNWASLPWHRTAYIFRYSTVPTIHRESVAEHTFFVSLWAYAIASEIKERYNVDMEAVLAGALVHDLDEAITGDFIRTFKYSSEEMREMISQQTERLMSDLHAPESLMTDWRRAKDKSLEGQIVTLADHFSVVIYAIREVKLGNEFAGELLERIPNVIAGKEWCPALREFVQEAIDIATEASLSRGGDRAQL